MTEQERKEEALEDAKCNCDVVKNAITVFQNRITDTNEIKDFTDLDTTYGIIVMKIFELIGRVPRDMSKELEEMLGKASEMLMERRKQEWARI